MVKSIIIVIINLDQTSFSRPKKLEAAKGYLTQVAWVWLECRLKSFGFYIMPNPRLLVLRQDPILLDCYVRIQC